MSDIFREVDEEYNRDRALELWNKHGSAIIGGIVALIAVVVGYNFWQSYAANQQAKQSDRFVAALELLDSNNAQPQEAVRAFEELASSSGAGYKILSRFLQANALIEAGELEQALSVYESISVDSAADKVMRDLAKVKAAYLVVDSASLDEISGRVSGLADGKNPWRHSAQELIAIAAFREGNVERARVEFVRLLGDPGTPQNMRAIAQEMLGVIGPVASAEGDAVSPVTETSEPETTGVVEETDETSETDGAPDENAAADTNETTDAGGSSASGESEDVDTTVAEGAEEAETSATP